MTDLTLSSSTHNNDSGNNSFAALGLNPALCDAAEKAGFKYPTSVQQASIPAILDGRDVLLPGQTGSGKTAGFMLPALQHLATTKQQEENCAGKDKYSLPRLLVLEPTRDLAMQVANVCRQLGRSLSLRTRVICGGVSREQQCKSLMQGADIIVATHGRLLDLAQQGDIILSEIMMLVLDEADRLLDEEFSESMTALIPYLADKPQTIFCSATLPAPVMALAQKVTRDPVRIELAEEFITPRKLRQRAIFTEEGSKQDLLLPVLLHYRQKNPDGRHILFVKTKNNADKLAKYLRKEGIKAGALHSGQTQGSRKSILARFQGNPSSQEAITTLVTTDIAARGLDITNITLVLNIDLPITGEIYVHRIGRTARAGRGGTALSFVTMMERSLLREIERHINHRIRIVTSSCLDS